MFALSLTDSNSKEVYESSLIKGNLIQYFNFFFALR